MARVSGRRKSETVSGDGDLGEEPPVSGDGHRALVIAWRDLGRDVDVRPHPLVAVRLHVERRRVETSADDVLTSGGIHEWYQRVGIPAGFSSGPVARWRDLDVVLSEEAGVVGRNLPARANETRGNDCHIREWLVGCGDDEPKRLILIAGSGDVDRVAGARWGGLEDVLPGRCRPHLDRGRLAEG